MASGRKLTKSEMDYRLRRLVVMGPWYGRALFALAMTPVVGVLTWMLQAFAGKDTQVDVSVVASISVVANIAMGYALRRKSNAMAEQRDELNRLRGRVDVLEAGVGTLKGLERGRS